MVGRGALTWLKWTSSRNLQEYRVRKAQHVSVREKDMLKYLAGMLALTVTGKFAAKYTDSTNSRSLGLDSRILG